MNEHMQELLERLQYSTESYQDESGLSYHDTLRVLIKLVDWFVDTVMRDD